MMTMNSESAVEQDAGWGHDSGSSTILEVSEPEEYSLATLTMPNGDPPTVTLWGADD